METTRFKVFLEKEELCVVFNLNTEKGEKLLIRERTGKALLDFCRAEKKKIKEIMDKVAACYRLESQLHENLKGKMFYEDIKEDMQKSLVKGTLSELHYNIYISIFIAHIIEVLCDNEIPPWLPLRLVNTKDDWISLDLLRRQSKEKIKEMYLSFIIHEIIKEQQKVKEEVNLLWEDRIDTAGLTLADRLCLLQDSKKDICLKQYKAIHDAKGNKHELNAAVHKAIFMKEEESHPIYELQHWEELVGFELACMVQSQVSVKACEYCGNWYVADEGAVCCVPAKAKEAETMVLDETLIGPKRFIAKRTPSGRPRQSKKVKGQLSLLDLENTVD